jgi:hypothetical protein
MKINFNNVRRNACRTHDRMIKLLNASIDDGQVIVDVDMLEDVLNDLRMAIGAIASTYIEGDDDFKDVFEEMYPAETKSHMAFFNPQDEDEE